MIKGLHKMKSYDLKKLVELCYTKLSDADIKEIEQRFNEYLKVNALNVGYNLNDVIK